MTIDPEIAALARIGLEEVFDEADYDDLPDEREIPDVTEYAVHSGWGTLDDRTDDEARWEEIFNAD